MLIKGVLRIRERESVLIIGELLLIWPATFAIRHPRSYRDFFTSRSRKKHRVIVTCVRDTNVLGIEQNFVTSYEQKLFANICNF